MKKRTKKELAEWLANENSDCGKDTYFDLNLTTEQAISKLLKENSKEELKTIVFDFSEEGQRYCG